jgi:hypothetical protein
MMRKLLAAVALAGLFFVSACNESDGSGDSASGGGATSGSTATSAPPSVADNTKKVCADIDALNNELKQKVVALVTRALQEAAAGDDAKAEKTLEEITTLIPDYAGKIEALGATATNSELKAVLVTMGADIRKSNEDTIEDVMTAAEAKYNAICSK